MNRSQIDDAIQAKLPFIIRTADGREFPVPTPDHIFVAPKGTFVQIFDDHERVNSVPILTMTSVEYHPAGES